MVCNFEDERWTEGVVLSRITMWAPNLEPKHNSVWSELTKSSCLKLPNLETKPDFSLTAPFPLVSPPPWADCRPKISWSSIWLELKSHYCHFERNKEAHRLLLQKKSGAAVAVKGKICPPLRQHWLISYLLSDFTSVHVCMWQWLLLPSCPYLGVEREGGGGAPRGAGFTSEHQRKTSLKLLHMRSRWWLVTRHCDHCWYLSSFLELFYSVSWPSDTVCLRL